MDAPRVLDLVPEQPNPPPRYGNPPRWKHRVRGRKVTLRDMSKVDTIVIHQTACTFGKGAWPSRHHRALGVACHNLAFRDGVVVRANPVEWYVYHGNGFNARSCGLEIEGSYPGLMDDPDTPRREDFATHWGDDSKMTPVTELVVETARLGLADLLKRMIKAGADPKYIVAHRQSSRTRRSDPGEELWKRIVLEYAVPELELQTRPDLVLGKGYTIPRDWDPAGSGRY